MKRCGYCGILKDDSEFVRGRMCRSCKSEYDKSRYQTRRNEILKRVNSYGKTERGREVNRRASLKYGSGGIRATNTKRWYQNLKSDPEKYHEHLLQKRAHNAVRYALKTGKMKREVCGVCGSCDDVQAHHKDYNRPLDVMWLCPLCHGITRRK